MFKYYNHLIKIEQSKDYVYDLLRSAFEEDKQLHSQNCPSWGKSVKQLKSIFNLDALDLSHVQFSKEMSTYYSGKPTKQLIHIRNSETGKLRFFSKILTTFQLQKYLTFNINKYVHSLLTKLRLSTQSLAIETGRYCKPKIPANERFCKACKDKVEDEYHFLIEYPIYNSARDKFFTLFNRKFNEATEVTINRLLNPSSSQDVNNICLYLKESYSLRDSTFKNI
jgi:hypothetical protein